MSWPGLCSSGEWTWKHCPCVWTCRELLRADSLGCVSVSPLLGLTLVVSLEWEQECLEAVIALTNQSTGLVR